MNFAGITLLGLGPGDASQLTRQAWQILENAPEIYLRTSHHPSVAGFPASLQVHSFDHLYARGRSFEKVYEAITQQVLELGRRPGGVVYAVPGHPYIAEATSPEIARRARLEGIPVRVVEGISFIEPACTALGIDPFPRLTLMDALELASAHTPAFPPDAPALIAQIYSREVASEVKLTLMEVYPDEHPVQYVHHAGSTDCLVESLHLYEIDRSPHIGLTSALYLPPLGPETSFEAFQEVIAHLRAPDGCPWDREQTHQSLRSNLLEETYEALAALDTSDYTALCEELGDLLLQIVLHAQIACEEGDFSMAEVLKHIHQKIVNRHPHVFGATKVGGVDEVLVNWERIKETERRLNGKKNSSLLDGVAAALPALAQSDQYQRRVIRAGFKWPDLQSKLDKIYEELVELQQAKTAEERALELGDVFFTIVNLAIHYEIDAESALREANSRFRKRFGYIEQKAQSQNRRLSELTLEEMLELWGEAKRQDT